MTTRSLSSLSSISDESMRITGENNNENEKQNNNQQLSHLLTSRGMLDLLRKNLGTWSVSATPDVKVILVQKSRLVVAIRVTDSISNSSGNVHGGALATMVDVLTSAIMFATDPRPSVSVDLHVSYLSAAPIGTTLMIESRVDHIGRSMIFGSCRIYYSLLTNTNDSTTKYSHEFREESGNYAMNRQDRSKTLVATGSHTKKIVGPGIISVTAPAAASNGNLSPPASKL
mmetsp:Transcript_20085/g.30201  ORF Transcript_20085/g.30201 Transcript_20085/m.30201 type:complete len:229 (+) Transcript_20085:2-688(+)